MTKAELLYSHIPAGEGISSIDLSKLTDIKPKNIRPILEKHIKNGLVEIIGKMPVKSNMINVYARCTNNKPVPVEDKANLSIAFLSGKLK